MYLFSDILIIAKPERTDGTDAAVSVRARVLASMPRQPRASGSKARACAHGADAGRRRVPRDSGADVQLSTIAEPVSITELTASFEAVMSPSKTWTGRNKAEFKVVCGRVRICLGSGARA